MTSTAPRLQWRSATSRTVFATRQCFAVPRDGSFVPPWLMRPRRSTTPPHGRFLQPYGKTVLPCGRSLHNDITGFRDALLVEHRGNEEALSEYGCEVSVGTAASPKRAAKLSPERRSQIARTAAAARWGSRPDVEQTD